MKRILEKGIGWRPKCRHCPNGLLQGVRCIKCLTPCSMQKYNVSPNACNLIISYLKTRKQRVKILGYRNQMATINRDGPQGSILRPLLFNISINDLMFVRMCSNIVNYADDHHVCHKHENTQVLCDIVKPETNTVICGLSTIIWMRIPVNFRASSWLRMCHNRWNCQLRTMISLCLITFKF